MHNTLGKWDELAEALRDELAEYGGLLGLLEEERSAIMGRKVDALLQINLGVQEQTTSAERRKCIREEVCSRLARSVGCAPDATVTELLNHMPAEARSMFESLVEEGMEVAESAQKKVRRNAILISRAGDMNERLLSAMRPHTTTKMYTKRGNLRVRTDHTVGGLDLSA
jgi:flagellar biosynthesis/type III secretory pathway chaperone